MPTFAAPSQAYVETLVLVYSDDPLVGSYYLDQESHTSWHTIAQISAATLFPKRKVSNILQRKAGFQDVEGCISGVLSNIPGSFAVTLHPKSTFDKFIRYAAKYDEVRRSEQYLVAIQKGKLTQEKAKAKAREATAAAAAARLPVTLDTEYTQIALCGKHIPGYRCNGEIYLAFAQIADLLDIEDTLVLDVAKQLGGNVRNIQTCDEYDEEIYRVFPIGLLGDILNFFRGEGNPKALRYK